MVDAGGDTSHIVELFNFSAEMQDYHFAQAFGKQAGLQLVERVTDSTALAIFNTPPHAAAALRQFGKDGSKRSFFSCRSFAEASPAAKQVDGSTLPAARRPQGTNTSAARLLLGSLGVRRSALAQDSVLAQQLRKPRRKTKGKGADPNVKQAEDAWD